MTCGGCNEAPAEEGNTFIMAEANLMGFLGAFERSFGTRVRGLRLVCLMATSPDGGA